MILGCLFVALSGGAMAGPPSGSMPGKSPPPPVVNVSVITEKLVNPPLEHVGRVEAIQAVDLRARVEGYLEQVKFKEGSDVSKGELMYVIEQTFYRAQVTADMAKVAEAEASLTRHRQYLERLKSVKSGGVSKTDLETALTDVQEALAKVDEARANLAKSKLDLDYTTVLAPISGRIGATKVTHGNLVGPGSGALARIVQLDPIRVVYSVSENDWINAKLQLSSSGLDEEKAKENLVPEIRLANGTKYELPGKIEFADNQVDITTGTIAVRAVFDNPSHILLPGQFVTVLISMSNPRKMPMVPQSAVLEDRDGRYVFVVDEQNKVEQRRIITGPAKETEWAVDEGLIVGETVIVSGIQKVRPGQTVNPVPIAERRGG